MKICKNLTLLMGSLLSLGLIAYSDVSTPAPVTPTKLIAVVNLPVSPNLDKISLNSNNYVAHAPLEGSYYGRDNERGGQRARERRDSDRAFHRGVQDWRTGGYYGRESDKQQSRGGSGSLQAPQPGGGEVPAAGAAEMSKSTGHPGGVSGGGASGTMSPAASPVSAPTPTAAPSATIGK